MSKDNDITTPYRGKYRQELDDEDTNPDTPEPDPEETDTPEPDPETVEEKTFKKRYGDLRSFHDKEVKKLKDELAAVSEKLSERQKALFLPKTPEEVEAWRKQYPEVFDIVRTIARKEAQEEKEELSKKFEDLSKREKEFAYERAYQKLLEKHPDFEELKQSQDLYDWLNEQPADIQSWLYENNEDYVKASRAIDLYKHDRGITHNKKETKKTDQIEASRSVKTKTKEPDQNTKPVYRLSEIQRMKPAEFEAKEKEIMQARREGRIIDDL